MADAPAFASTVALGSVQLGAVETNLNAPAQSSVVLAAGASGTKIEEVVVEAATTSLTPTTVAGLVYLFLFDGTTYYLFDTISVTAVTASATTAPYRGSTRYPNLWLKSGWSLKASQSHTTNANLLKVTALGADF